MTEEQTTSELDQALMEGLEVFDGQAVKPIADEPAEPSETDPALQSEGQEPPEPVSEKESRPTAEYRFRSHEEAEEGYRHLQREKTIAEQRAKVLEAELQKIKNAEKRRQEETKEDEAFEAYATQRHMQALMEIDELDPDDPDYKKKVAACWARSQRDIRKWQPRDTERVEEKQETTDIGSVPHEDTLARIRAYTNEFIVKEGLAENDPLFWHYAAQAPVLDEQGRELPLDAQIRWAIAQTRNYHAAILAEQRRRWEAEASARGRETAQREIPLGRSAAEKPPGETEPARPISLAEALDSALEQRRL